jgi:tRNA(His) 5'-end guanylyltransferase
LKSARQSAAQAVGQGTWSRWKRYVEEAAKFYNFDSSQVATAQSILQEYLERVQTSLRDETWRQRVYDNRLWLRMMWTLPGGWQNPLRAYLEGEYVEMVDPIMVLERQFKERIDDIPTLVQREAAAQHMERILAEKGLGLEEPLPQSQASEGGTRP